MMDDRSTETPNAAGAVADTSPTETLEARIGRVGTALGRSLVAVIDAVPGGPFGPQDFATKLGIDKVLASRLLKAARHRDPIAVAYFAPGPDPIRRMLRAAGRHVGAPLINEAQAAVDGFEQLIRQGAGDRIALDAIISTWLPEARREFELRRKQSAFKAMSQLKGAMAETNLAAVLLHPSDDGESLDIVWVTGLLGLQRLRPGASVHLATRRIVDDEGGERRPVSLDGVAVEDARLDEFCSSPAPALEATRAGNVVHYALGDTGYGPRSAVDLVFAEVNRAEIPRYVPAELKRKGYLFAEVGTPCKSLHFDVLVHEEVYPGSEPDLVIYDTVLDGVADVNDRARDADRLDLLETIERLGTGLSRFGSVQVPHYPAIMRHVCSKLGWDDRRFRGYRCRIDYPIYGAQVAMTFDPPPPP